MIYVLYRVNAARNKNYDIFGRPNIQNMLDLLEKYRVGNCMEDANAAALILKMNGIKNVYTAILTSGNEKVDHMVCVFNKDGSKFSGKIKNSTIIIDPWARKADFAKNMMIYYKNEMCNSLNIQGSYFTTKGRNICSNDKMGLEKYASVYLSEKELNEFKNQYPEFVFKSNNRKFMA